MVYNSEKVSDLEVHVTTRMDFMNITLNRKKQIGEECISWIQIFKTYNAVVYTV